MLYSKEEIREMLSEWDRWSVYTPKLGAEGEGDVVQGATNEKSLNFNVLVEKVTDILNSGKYRGVIKEVSTLGRTRGIIFIEKCKEIEKMSKICNELREFTNTYSEIETTPSCTALNLYTFIPINLQVKKTERCPRKIKIEMAIGKTEGYIGGEIISPGGTGTILIPIPPLYLMAGIIMEEVVEDLWIPTEAYARMGPATEPAPLAELSVRNYLLVVRDVISKQKKMTAEVGECKGMNVPAGRERVILIEGERTEEIAREYMDCERQWKSDPRKRIVEWKY